jgi:transposase InsO family protein
MEQTKVFADALEALPASHEFIPVRTPNIYDRHLNEQYLWGLRDAYQWMTEFMAFYNEFRIHGSLGMSPKESLGAEN